MRYMVRGKIHEAALPPDAPREDLLKSLHHRIVPTLQCLVQHQRDGQVLGGGVAPMDTVFIILELPDSSLVAARRFLMSLPAFDLFDWDVTPLETFEELVNFFDPSK